MSKLFRDASWLYPLRGTSAAWGIGAFLCLILSSGLAQAQTPAGTSISNVATASYSLGGVTGYATSNRVSISVGSPTTPPAPAIVVDPDRTVSATGGDTVRLGHVVRNTGTAGGSFILSATSPAAWPIRIYMDLNGNGVLDSGEPEITGPVTLAAGDSIAIVVAIGVPSGFTDGDVHQVTVTATSSTNPAITDNALDTIKGHKKEEVPTTSLAVQKQVDRSQAKPGDVLTYTISAEVSGNTAATNVVITDPIPAGVVYQNGSLQIDGRSLTDSADTDEGTYQAIQPAKVVFRIGTVQAGSKVVMKFRALVASNATPGSTITNAVSGTFGPNGEGSSGPAATATTVVMRQFNYKLTKRALAPISKKVGETVQYRIVATNLISSGIDTLRVTDTIPALLDFVSSTPAPTTTQGAVRSWLISVGPLDSTVILVNARVNSNVATRTAVLNTAHAIIDTVARSDTATIFVDPTAAAKLEIGLSARSLEVAMGQTAVLTATVKNAGPETLDDLVVEVTLPEGTKYVPGSLAGADFVSVNGTKLMVRIPGTLASQASTSFTYSIAIVSPPSTELVNLAIATARAGSVISNEAKVILHMLASMAAQTNVVVGRVWADDNANGRQDDGELGLANIDVWTEDGAVARTDVDGKFSFVNLRLGTHVFRADPTTIPGGYMVARNEDGLIRARLTGWTSPRILLPMLPAPGAEAAALRLALKQKPVTSPKRSEQASRQEDPDDDEATTPAQLALLVGGPSPTTIAPLTRVAAPVAPIVVKVPPALTEEQRKAEKSREFLQGPGVEIVWPTDGTVLGTDRIAVIGRGERNMPSALYLGDSLYKSDAVRLDGAQEFAAVPLHVGPNLITLQVKNSWGNTRSDKVRVHVSGPIAHMVADSSRIVVPADGQTPARVRVQLFDKWGVPVVNRPFVDVKFDGGTIDTPDATKMSVGLQAQADESGWVVVDLKGGLNVGRSKIELKAGDIKTSVDVEMIARARPMMMIGTGQVGIGASPNAYGSLSVRGRITETTALTVSYDTRRLDDGRNAFNRTTDPLSNGIYPILGDASSMRTVSAARGQISARLERGLDNVTFGDVQTSTIAEDFTLTRYSRSITGASARVSTGALVWSAFGASSSQSLSQVQLRGAGTSGPYNLGRSIIAGTQQVQVELRDRLNAQRVLSRIPLIPYIDYEIDPVRGEIILKRALPSADESGNSMFLVVTAESAGNGARKSLFGVRVATELGDLTRKELLKGVTIGTSMVHDAQSLHPLNMVGADLRFAPTKNIDLAAEMAHSDVTDSSGIASSVRGSVRLFNDALTLGARWNKIGKGFANPSNASLMAGTTDMSASAALQFGGGVTKLEHTRQDFGPLGISRARTQLSVHQDLAYRSELDLSMSDDDINGGTDPRQLGLGQLKFSWSPVDKLKFWAEGNNRLYSRGSDQNATGASYGGGLSLQAMENVAVEVRHMSMAATNGKANYSLTNIGIRSQLASGAQAWGSYQLVGGSEGARNAAIVGLNNTLRITNSITVSGMYERRMGVQRSTADDPVRALPFSQPEPDYWASSLGLEFLPQDKPYRLSLKGERKNGTEKSTMFQAAGDVTLGTSFGILSRQEFSGRENLALAQGSSMKTDHRASLWGLVWRPRSTEKFNTLMELRWSQDKTPSTLGTLDRRGEDERLSAAFEAIWSPLRRVELGSRYAIRKSSTILTTPGAPDINQKSDASFLGTRLDVGVARFLVLRGEARAMMERRSGSRTWDVAPAAVIRPIQGIEVAAGRRWGPLNDPDFAVNGGKGWFATVSARVTESSFPTATAFWRNRFQR